MSQQTKAWARHARFLLLLSLGPQCKQCGARRDLTFDVIQPLEVPHHHMPSDTRMSFYLSQARSGNVQVLCRACNSRKGNHKPAPEKRATPRGDRGGS